jgi:putative toxin-antitoxin system antitoxin component (TIGR02293 family)
MNSTVIPRPRDPQIRGRSLGFSSSDVRQIVGRVEAGFPYSALEKFRKATRLPLAMIAELVRIPPRTLVRRRAAGKLTPDESERLLRLATIFERALDLFEGDLAATMNWLITPKKALAGESPLPFSQTEIGARAVESLIGRLEHGVFS